MTKVKMSDLNELGYCMRSVRPWLANHGFDVKTCLREGIPMDELAAVDDEFARRAVEHAKAREAADGQ